MPTIHFVGGVFLYLAVDGILYRDETVVLIRRAGRTFHGSWALPGGRVEENELVESALRREMLEEVGVGVEPQGILGVYSAPERDPRGHTISVVFICDYQGKLAAGSDAATCQAFSLEEALTLPLAFDHHQILADFQQWLKQPETFWSSKGKKERKNE